MKHVLERKKPNNFKQLFFEHYISPTLILENNSYKPPPVPEVPVRNLYLKWFIEKQFRKRMPSVPITNLEPFSFKGKFRPFLSEGKRGGARGGALRIPKFELKICWHKYWRSPRLFFPSAMMDRSPIGRFEGNLRSIILCSDFLARAWCATLIARRCVAIANNGRN